MTKRKNRILLALAGVGLAALLALSTGLALKESNAAVQSAFAIEEEYDQNTRFSIPEYEMTINGKKVTATGVLIFPDGTAKSGDRILLDIAGKYTLRYTAVSGGKVKTEDFTFLVHQSMVSSLNGSSVEYGAFMYEGVEKAKGLQVKLARNDTITFNQLIDVKDVTSSDFLVEGFATPQTLGNPDMDKMTFVFTDSENPDIYLTVTNRRYANETEKGHSYYLAGGQNQALSGVEKNGNKLHVNDIYGTWSNHGYTGEYYTYPSSTTPGFSSAKSPSDYPFKIALDTATMEVHGDTGFIIDLDSTEYFERLWTGFPSGKARLSISVSGFNNATADFFITNVRGIDLSEKRCPDQDPPVITIDESVLDEQGNMPRSAVGAAYKIPSATATDYINGDCAVDVRVWYDYASSNAANVAVTNGTFVTSRFGNYTIVYTAHDYAGNTATRLLTVETVSSLDPVSVTAPEGAPRTAVLGEDVEIPAPAAVSGGSGNKSVRVTAKLDSETVEIENGIACFEREGSWVITYEATDYLGNKGTASYTITVTRGTAPILKDAVVLPELYLAGFEYTLPTLYVNDYTSGTLVKRACEVVVTDANGEKTYAAGAKFTPTVENHGDSVTLAYRYNGVTYFEKSVDAAKTVGSSGVILENYFYGTGFTAAKSASGMILTSGGGDFTWKFANTLLAELFSIELENIHTATNFGSITLLLADEVNPEIAISVGISPGSSKTYVEVDGKSYEIDYKFTQSVGSGATNVLSIGYSNGSIVFGSTLVDVTKTVSGEKFEGFPSGKVTLTCSTEGVSGAAAYKVVSINEHRFTNSFYDFREPQLLITGVHGGSFALNDIYAIPTVMVSDVLCPTTEVKMTVTFNGEPVEDINGVLLSDVTPDRIYEIKLSKYGAYLVTYTYREVGSMLENSGSFDYAVNVEDREAPTIAFTAAFQSTVKVGDYIIIPDFTVKDNRTAAEGIIVIKQVINPYGVYIMLSGNSIKCDYVGVYRVQVFAIDEAGNITTHTVNITVTD